MAENEIIKHSRKAIAIIKSSGKSLRHKLFEIFVEILIIVIAVSITIELNNWNERRHNAKEERDIFIGLKKDLQSDMANMTNSEGMYEYILNAGRSLSRLRRS